MSQAHEFDKWFEIWKNNEDEAIESLAWRGMLAAVESAESNDDGPIDYSECIQISIALICVSAMIIAALVR